MIVDKGGTIVSVNRALEQITGYAKDEMLGQPCSILNCNIFEYARKDTGEHWCVLFKTGRMNMRKCTFIKKDGRFINVLKNASLLHDADGNVMGALANDIGVLINSSIDNSIGDVDGTKRNVISGNRKHNILIKGFHSTHNTIAGNFIGTDDTGTQELNGKKFQNPNTQKKRLTPPQTEGGF